MRLRKIGLVIAGAAASLGLLVGAASAGRLSTTSQTARDTFREVRFSGGFGTTVCNVTAEGSFHSKTIAKTAGLLLGYLTSVAVGGCTQGSATVLRETLPWHVRYQGFTGTLPNISTVVLRVVGVAFAIREPVFGITCLARATEAVPTIVTFTREASGALTGSEIGGTLPTNCGAEGTLQGTSNSFTVLNSASRITVTLI
jgi:hypothetical protein